MLLFPLNGKRWRLRRKLLLCCLLFIGATCLRAQNLVPNPSFEDTANCEIQVQCALLTAAGWLNPNTATPDVFEHDLERGCGIPMDPDDVMPEGYFHLPRTGSRFGGIMCWYGPGSSNARDYLMMELEQSLTPGTRYLVSCWYLLPSSYRYAIDHLGVWFGPEAAQGDNPNWLPLVPQLRLRDGDFLSEGEAWTMITDTLLATGNERWMVIGNFDEPEQINGAVVNSNAFDPYAYYYIDDVSIEALPSTVGLPSISGTFNDGVLSLNWLNGQAISDIRIIDGIGRAVIPTALEAEYQRAVIALPSIATGLYIVVVTLGDRRYTLRLIK